MHAMAPRLLVLGIALTLGCHRTAPPAGDASERSPAPANAQCELPSGYDVAVEERIGQWGRHWPSFRMQGVVAVATDGELELAKAYGYRDLAEQVEHDVSSPFMLGTLSTHLTVLTALRLAAEGRLDLDAPVTRYLPEFERPETITLEHLLANTSGLPSFTKGMVRTWNSQRAWSNAELVALVSKRPLEFEPGTDFAPSNTNAALMGRVLEVATGSEYPAVVREAVLDPLGLDSTHYGVPNTGAAVGLRYHEDEYLAPVHDFDPRSMGAAGAWVSTASDLVLLYSACNDPQWLPDALRSRLFGDNPSGRPYGFVSDLVEHRGAYQWLGLAEGHHHAVLLIPEERRVFVVLANSDVIPGGTLVGDLARLAYGVRLEDREEPEPRPLDVEALEPLAGTWELVPEQREHFARTTDRTTLDQIAALHIDVSGARADLSFTGRPSKRMHAVNEREFFFKDLPQSTAHLLRGPRSREDRLELRRDDTRLRYRRAPDERAHTMVSRR